MTVITNLVVALMIVTSGEEPVKARVIHEPSQSLDSVWVVREVGGPVETLYRKTCKTNYVYSADIHIERLSAFCHVLGCDKKKQFTAEDVFGKEVKTFGVLWNDEIFCKEHEKAEVKK